MSNSLSDRLGSLMREVLKFGIVGGAAFLVDIGLFNVLRYGVFTEDKPLTAKTISVVVATAVAYLGNRHWTFRERGRQGLGRETSLFVALNAIALVMALSCLWMSHYVLGLQGALADNISANVIGLGMGTAFRFWSYRRWVFVDAPAAPVPAAPAPVRVPALSAAGSAPARSIAPRERLAAPSSSAA